jgi:hypothetical protein
MKCVNRKPTLLATLFLDLFVAVLILPGVIVVAHDSLTHRPACCAEHHRAKD